MTVNPIYINYIFSPLIGGADIEEEVIKYSVFNSDNINDQEILIKTFLLPDFKSQNALLQQEVKKALSYYYLNRKLDFGDIIDSLLLPIKTPKDTYGFMKKIWTYFFAGENMEAFIENKVVIEDYDINAPFKLLSN